MRARPDARSTPRSRIRDDMQRQADKLTTTRPLLSPLRTMDAASVDLPSKPDSIARCVVKMRVHAEMRRSRARSGDAGCGRA